MAGHGPEGHTNLNALHDASNCSIAQVGMLPDNVAVKMVGDPGRSTASPIVICKRNSRLPSARCHGSR